MRTPRWPGLLRLGQLWRRESLPSFVVRLAQLNFYDPVTILRELCLAGPEPDRLDWPLRSATYERLYDLTWIDPYTLHAATGHRFAGTLTPPGEPEQSLRTTAGYLTPLLTPERARQHLRPESAAQFCPLCLQEAPYHRVSWLPIAVAACLRHHRLLVARCPVCQERISVRAIVAECRCPGCGLDLRQIRAVRLAADPQGLQAQRFIQSWLGLTRAPVGPWQRLPLSCRAALFHFVDGLRDSLLALGSDWPGLHHPPTRSPWPSFGPLRGHLTPDQSYRLYGTACQVLLDWPGSFYTLLRAYTQRAGRSPRRSVWDDLGRILQWVEERWQHPLLAFVQRAVDRYLVATYVAAPGTNSANASGGAEQSAAPTYVSPYQAARLLGVSFRTVGRLVEAGFLVPYPGVPERTHWYGAVQQDEVLLLRQRWRQAVPLADAAQWLGLSERDVMDLGRVGLLTPGLDPTAEEDTPGPLPKPDLDRCYSRVAGCATAVGSWHMTGLPEAVQVLGAVGLQAADILQHVVAGKLWCASWPQFPALRDLLFQPLDIAALLKSPPSGRGLWDCRGAAQRIGVDLGTFFRWLDAGLLAPTLQYADEEYFAPAVLDGFQATYVLCDQAAQLLRVEEDLVRRWTRAGWLRIVPGSEVDKRAPCLLYREEIERLRVALHGRRRQGLRSLPAEGFPPDYGTLRNLG